MHKKYITRSFKETQKLGKELAEKILSQRPKKTAVVLVLQGDLGDGKTTFLQGFAKGLGIKEKILSPTFIIYKKFEIKNNLNSLKERSLAKGVSRSSFFYHFDCYRINKPEEILNLGFKKIISDPKNIIAIEWPEKIKKYLPKNSILIKFKFINQTTREIVVI